MEVTRLHGSSTESVDQVELRQHTVICAGLVNSPSTLGDSERDLNEAANSNEQHTAGCLK